MTKDHQRLVKCFVNVFPGIKPEEIPGASAESLAAWDSVAHITLLIAIAEEFGVEFEPDDFEELVSFSAIEEYLEKRAEGSAH